MSEYLNSLAHQIFNKSFTHCTQQEIENLAQQYPYFAPAQFLLLKKLDPGTEAYDIQYRKAILYHHNPLEFEQFFQAENFTSEPLVATGPALMAEAAPVETGDTILPAQLTENISLAESILEEAPEPTTGIDEPEPQPAYEPNAEREEPLPEVQEFMKVEPVEEHSARELVSENTGSVPEVPNETTAVVLPEEAPYEPLPSEPDMAPAATEEVLPEPATADAEPPEPVSAEPAPAPKGPDLLFEPFHTVDYFASQGIRVSEEAPKDRFGKQLKSFTEWLKTMKKIPATDIAKTIDPHSEKGVQHLASHSIQEAEVLTEAMAEVWIKQGAYRKAEEVYHKLSLQHPAKRAYFATKIDHLKKLS
ncbi:MAG TPA: hypothetical protein VHK69_19270 [Chitinophagaceae bacterium]|jgi:hypothetical protein|nr:hypothetical protein [Chitinophagaceae bacterium]